MNAAMFRCVDILRTHYQQLLVDPNLLDNLDQGTCLSPGLWRTIIMLTICHTAERVQGDVPIVFA